MTSTSGAVIARSAATKQSPSGGASNGRKYFIPGSPAGRGPESTNTGLRKMDSGLVAAPRPRNDGSSDMTGIGPGLRRVLVGLPLVRVRAVFLLSSLILAAS